MAVSKKKIKVMNLAKLLKEAEDDIRAGRICSARAFLKSFKQAKRITR